ncbi:probable programmed cell death protein 2-like [Coccomyxa sp. Obi]|nr:probable programmed cell death protein 2-like [Coccomyxa sp. Obi]
MKSSDNQGVVLGLAGDLIFDSEKLTHRHNKAGGRPVFAGMTPPLELQDVVCRVCGSTLSLVVQVSSPEKNPQAQDSPVERVLYILGCTHEGCGQLEGSWRALSHETVHRASDLSVCQASADPAPKDGTLDEAVSGSQQLDWGATDTAQSWGPSSTSLQPTSMPNSSEDWGLDHTGWLDEPSAAAAADAAASTSLEQLSMALEGLTTNSSATTKACGLRKVAAKRGKAAESKGPKEPVCTLNGLPALPEFHLMLESEPGADGKLKTREQKHVEALLAQYQREEGLPQVEEPTSSGQGGGGWGGEGYEKPSAASADLAFHRYAKRLQRKPEQCIRLGGALLWPKEQQPQLDRCRCCGDDHEQILEVQLMAPLIPMLEEAAQWVKDGHAGPARAADFVPVPLSWEWLTIGVFSCGNTASKADSCGVVEKTVVIANE